MRQRLLALKRDRKRLILAAGDALLLPLALWLAFSLRLERFYWPETHALWALFVAAPLLAVPVFIRLGLYRAVIHHMDVPAAAWRILRAVSLATLVWGGAALLSGATGVPPSVLLLYGALMFLLVGGVRLAARWWLGGGQRAGDGRKRVAVYGAGDAGVQLVAALRAGSEMRPMLFIDEDPALARHEVAGLRVFAPDEFEAWMAAAGATAAVGMAVGETQIDEVLLALSSANRARRRQIIDWLEPYAVQVRALPSLDELAGGRVRVEDIRDIDAAELLGRDATPPIESLLAANIRDRAVLVTGAGGSIGSELCRRILRLRPRRLLLFERSEEALYRIGHELRAERDALEEGAKTEIVALLGSVRNQRRVAAICRRYAVCTIYHAAAYKHVPLVERNPLEGVDNNILGTLYAARAAIASGVETFVLISTDKAVRPTSVMGAAKRFAELILQGLAAERSTRPPRFTMVRFGNVLDSSGSVVPLFRRQIRAGGPITVTHPQIVRYFMTIPEAAELVLQAGAMGEGGEVFVLDMGEPVEILQLARRMIHLSGLEVKEAAHPDGDIEIRFTGLRPGEKLYEELLIGADNAPTAHPKILRAREESLPWAEIERLLGEFERALEEDDEGRIRALLREAVRGYTPAPHVADEE